MFSLTLTQPPSTNALRTAFVKQGRVRQVKSPEYNRWLIQAGKEAIPPKWSRMPPPPYEITIGVGKCNQRRDLDNFQKPAIDFLVKAGFIEKDNLTTVHKVSAERKFGIVPDGKITIDIDYYDPIK